MALDQPESRIFNLKQSEYQDHHAIAPVQKTRGDHNTFVEVSSSIFKAILHECSDSIRIDVIFDVYREETIKDIERAVRGQEYCSRSQSSTVEKIPVQLIQQAEPD